MMTLTAALSFILRASQSATKIGLADSSLLAPALVAAIVSAVVALTTFALSGRRARIDRQRQLFGEAFAAVMEYREYPFIVRRRSTDEPSKERQRISTDLSAVQVKLKAFEGSLRLEAPEVGKRYAKLVAATRRVAGTAIHDAWDADPVTEGLEDARPALQLQRARSLRRSLPTSGRRPPVMDPAAQATAKRLSVPFDLGGS